MIYALLIEKDKLDIVRAEIKNRGGYIAQHTTTLQNQIHLWALLLDSPIDIDGVIDCIPATDQIMWHYNFEGL